MDISKLVEDGARALALQEHSAKGVAQIWDNDLQPERGNYESAARAVLAIALAAAAEKAEAWSHNSTGTRNPEQAMQEAAQDTLAEKIAERFHTLATQLGAANG